ncbi:MAG TPA: hypothetical protein IAB62_00770 [Candidatus Coprocola pullicola]|nr:hypothetical protein [Candidatus Coprocola pullicola]
MSFRLISKNEQNPIETEYITSYKVQVKTPKTSVAKAYEIKNEMLVTLEVPKSDYQNINVQRLLQWAKMPVYDEGYYRDLAVNIKVEELSERSIVFTHAKMTSKVITDTKADKVTILLTINQKEDMFAGVVFGEDLEDTYQKAWTRALNPPLPPAVIDKEDLEFYSNTSQNLESKKQMPSKEFELINNGNGKTDIFCDIPWIWTKRQLVFGQAKKKPLIYCNYPEAPFTEFFKNDILLINRVKLKEYDEALVYLSYGKTKEEKDPRTFGRYRYMVRVYNPNPEELIVYVRRHGKEDSDDWDLAICAWQAFCTDKRIDDIKPIENEKKNGKFEIPYDHSVVIMEGKYHKDFLEVLSSIKVYGEAVVAVYLIRDDTRKLIEIPNYSNVKPYLRKKEKGQLTYSGIAPTWQLSTCVEVDAKDVLYQSDLDKYYPESTTDINQKKALEKHKEELETSYFYQLCYPRKKNPENGQVDNKCNKYESNPIHLIEGGFLGNNPDGLANLDRDDNWVANVNNEEEWYDNVANYAVQYNMKFIFSNSAQHSINIKVYLISNASSHCAGIEFGGKAVGKFLQPNREKVEDKISNPNRWYLFEGTIPPTKTEADKKVLEFRYMHLSKGSAPCMLQLQAKKV